MNNISKFKTNDELEVAVNNLKVAKEHIKEGTIRINNIIKISEGSSWSGESKKSFLNLMLLCRELNEKLLEASEENEVKINNFINNNNSFINSNLLIKNLED
ncbi:MAG: hypothetical protein ACRC7N_07430 [Clostridium sp.]